MSALTKESNARGTPLFQRADLQELAEKRLRLQVGWLVELGVWRGGVEGMDGGACS